MKDAQCKAFAVTLPYTPNTRYFNNIKPKAANHYLQPLREKQRRSDAGPGSASARAPGTAVRTMVSRGMETAYLDTTGKVKCASPV
jgi:hypothetical protein